MKKIINCDKAPAALGPYSHANVAGNMVFISGQLPMRDGELLKDTKDQARACLENMGYILKEACSSFENVVKVTIFLSDMSLFAEVNEVYGEFFKENCPARSCIAVKGLPKNADMEMEAIAIIG